MLPRQLGWSPQSLERTHEKQKAPQDTTQWYTYPDVKNPGYFLK